MKETILTKTPGLEHIVLVALTGWGQQWDDAEPPKRASITTWSTPREPKAWAAVLAGLIAV